MNKRGQEADTKGPGPIVAAVIAAAVLVFVILGIWLWASGKGIPFFEFLPSFNQTKPPVVGVEMFMLNITSDNDIPEVKYYDGLNWNDFPKSGQIEVNGKPIFSSDVFGPLYSLYFRRSGSVQKNVMVNAPILDYLGKKTGEVPTNIDLSFDIYGQDYLFRQAAPADSFYFIHPSGFEGYWRPALGSMHYQAWSHNGNMYIVMKQKKEFSKIGSSIYPVFILKMDNTLEYVHTYKGESEFEISPPYDTQQLKIIKDAAIAWRDSILLKPVTIVLTGAGNQPIKVCLMKERYDVDKALVVDLSSPAVGDACA